MSEEKFKELLSKASQYNFIAISIEESKGIERRRNDFMKGAHWAKSLLVHEYEVEIKRLKKGARNAKWTNGDNV